MDSSQQSTIVNENILEQALRTYEESERSLKSICYSIEQENIQLENQLKQFQLIYNNRIQQSKQIQQQIDLTQQDFNLLNEKLNIFNQQTNSFHQRYEQVQLALKQILCLAISTTNNHQFEEQTYSELNCKLIPISSNHFNRKRKSINQHSTPKHQKNIS